MVFIAGVFLLLQTMIRPTAKVGQGEAEGKTEDGDNKKRKIQISGNLKVI